MIGNPLQVRNLVSNEHVLSVIKNKKCISVVRLILGVGALSETIMEISSAIQKILNRVDHVYHDGVLWLEFKYFYGMILAFLVASLGFSLTNTISDPTIKMYMVVATATTILLVGFLIMILMIGFRASPTTTYQLNSKWMNVRYNSDITHNIDQHFRDTVDQEYMFWQHKKFKKMLLDVEDEILLKVL